MDIEKLKNNLGDRGISCVYFETRDLAATYLLQILSSRTIGIGGSKTIEALGLYDKLLENNRVAWHWTSEDADAARNEAYNAEVYLCSVNAISETGEIVNIDGRGNRLTGTMYNKKEVYYVVGINKIRNTLEEAIWRARNIASPLNARRFGLKTPCASGELKCHDCKSPQRICKEMLITLGRPGGIEKMEVIIVNEDLGY